MVTLLLDNGCVAASQRLIQRLCTAQNHSLTMTGHVLVQVWTKRLLPLSLLSDPCVGPTHTLGCKSHSLLCYLDKEIMPVHDTGRAGK